MRESNPRRGVMRIDPFRELVGAAAEVRIVHDQARPSAVLKLLRRSDTGHGRQYTFYI
jgi:hypothetical protein